MAATDGVDETAGAGHSVSRFRIFPRGLLALAPLDFERDSLFPLSPLYGLLLHKRAKFAKQKAGS